MDEHEIPLEGGNATDGVVRIGSTAGLEFMHTVRAAGQSDNSVVDSGEQEVHGTGVALMWSSTYATAMMAVSHQTEVTQCETGALFGLSFV